MRSNETTRTLNQPGLNSLHEKTWRLLNSVLFASAFLGPWSVILGDIVMGKDLVRVSTLFLLDLLPGRGPVTSWVGWALYHYTGWLFYLLYWSLNIARVLTPIRSSNSRWVNSSLLFCFLFVAIDTGSLIIGGSYHSFWQADLYWGRWLLVISFISAAVLELFSWASRRFRIRE